MLWNLVLLCLLTKLVQNVYGISFSSEVFYRTLIINSEAGPVKVADPVKRKPSLSLEEAISSIQSGHLANEDIANLIQAALILTYEKLPNEFNLRNITLSLPVVGGLHLGLGKVKGIQSFDNPVVSSVPNNNGKMDITAEMRFSSLSVHYDDIFLDLHSMMYSKHAKGLMWFRSNKLIAQGTLVKVSEIPGKLGKDCVLYVRRAEISKMGYISVDIYTDKNERSVLLNSIVATVTSAIVEVLTYQLNLAMNMILKEYLPESKANVCRHPKMQEAIDSMSTPNSKVRDSDKGDENIMAQTVGYFQRMAGELKLT